MILGIGIEISRRYAHALSHPGCSGPHRSPLDVGILDYQEVTFTPPGNTDTVRYKAWWLPSENGAAVILIPGFGHSRDGMLDQGAMLAGHGYGVLLIDPRYCASPDAVFTAGYNLLDGRQGYRLGPLVGYEYLDVEVDGYTEVDGTASSIVVQDQDVSTGIWSGGLFGDIRLSWCDCEVYGELVYRAYTDDEGSDPRLGQATVAGNSARLPGYRRDEDGWRWDLGLAARLSDNLELNLGAGAADADQRESLWYGLNLAYSF